MQKQQPELKSQGMFGTVSPVAEPSYKVDYLSTERFESEWDWNKAVKDRGLYLQRDANDSVLNAYDRGHYVGCWNSSHLNKGGDLKQVKDVS